MKKSFLLLAIIIAFQANRDVTAAGWISVGIPAIYQFTGAENSLFSSGSTLNGQPSGYMVYGSIYDMPFLGYEQYQISIRSDDSDEPSAVIDVQFYDIGLHFQQRYTYFLIGYGYGSIILQCELSTCSSYQFEEGIARQYFGQLGVLLFGNLHFYLGAHRVTGQNDVTVGSVSDHLVMDGLLYTFGLKLNF